MMYNIDRYFIWRNIVKKYIIRVLNGMALGLFSSLLIGLILKQIGILTNLDILVRFGDIAQRLMAPAIGAGVAHAIGAPGLVIFSSMIAGAIGGGAVNAVDGQTIISIGEPVGALLSSLVGAEVGKRLAGKTKVDIILLPASVIIIGGLVGYYLSPAIAQFMNAIGEIINFATKQQPFLMGIIISSVMGLVLTLPTSSAAIGISLGLNGLAAGAAVVGGASHMIGFAVASYKDNGFGGLISQGLGTSMLQISNIVKKPIILMPAIITSLILGPVSTVIFKMEATAAGSGMGTSGLVGQFSTYEVMGNEGLIGIALLHFILPAVISYTVTKIMRKKGLIKQGDMLLTTSK